MEVAYLVVSGATILGIFIEDPDAAEELVQKAYEEYDLTDADVIPVDTGYELATPIDFEEYY